MLSPFAISLADMNGHFIGADRAHIVAAHLNAGGNGIAAAVCGNVGKIGDYAHLAAVDGVKVARRAAQRDGQRPRSQR